MIKQYMKISLDGGGSYTQPMSEVLSAVDGELDGLVSGDTATLSFTVVEMEESVYEALPEFTGH